MSALFRDKGVWFTALFSSLMLLVTAGEVVLHANHVYFNLHGDGFQTYYTALYHILHDTQAGTQRAMNYPFSESVFFTGCEPVLSVPLQFINRLLPVHTYTTGIINLSMLLSLILCSVFLYLLLRQFQIKALWAVAFAVGITFTSPQVQRLMGHYTLTYQFAIPYFLWQLTRLYERPSYRISLQIGVVAFLLAATHLYFLGFLCFICVLFWPVMLLTKQMNLAMNCQSAITAAKHMALQLLLPLLLLQVLISVTSPAEVRTSMPWGLMSFKTSIDGMFYPFAKPYEWVIKQFHYPDQLDWEGLTFFGIFSWISLVLVSVVWVTRIIQHRVQPTKWFWITGHVLIDVFFWSGIVAATYACGYILFIRIETLLPYLGVLKQMRGIGRFAWLLYYTFSIAGVYCLFQLTQRLKHVFTGNLIVAAVCIMLLTDASYNMLDVSKRINNTLPLIEDTANQLPQNTWLNSLNPSAYQAILPLPFFQVGSENFGIGTQHAEVMLNTQLISLKTGLPMVSMASSRSPLIPSWLNFQYALEISEPLDVLNRYPSDKPLLMVVWPDKIPHTQQELLSRGKLIFNNSPYYLVYELSLDAARKLGTGLYARNESDLLQLESPVYVNGFTGSDSGIVDMIINDFETESKADGFYSRESKMVEAQKQVLLIDTLLRNRTDSSRFTCSFWIKDLRTDLAGRIFIYIKTTADGASESDFQTLYLPACITTAQGAWSMIEFPVNVPLGNSRMQIILHNTDLPKGEVIYADKLMIKPAHTIVYRKSTQIIMRNNRYYTQANVK